MVNNEMKFSQGEFIKYLKDHSEYLNKEQLQEALAVSEKHCGLCDIICNQITQENLLENKQ